MLVLTTFDKFTRLGKSRNCFIPAIHAVSKSDVISSQVILPITSALGFPQALGRILAKKDDVIGQANPSHALQSSENLGLFFLFKILSQILVEKNKKTLSIFKKLRPKWLDLFFGRQNLGQ